MWLCHQRMPPAIKINDGEANQWGQPGSTGGEGSGLTFYIFWEKGIEMSDVRSDP